MKNDRTQARQSSLGRKLTALLALTSLVATLAVTVSAGAAGPVVNDIGIVDLQLSAAGDSFEWIPDTGTGSSQPLTQSKCKVNSPEPLVDLSAAAIAMNPTPHPGLKDHTLGVRAKGEGQGEPCSRIDDAFDQVLIMELTGELSDKFIHGAQFGVKLKFGATATVQLWNNGSEVAGAYGEAICLGGDCGSDSGGDLETLILPANDGSGNEYIGDELRFTVSTPSDGAFSIIDDPVSFDSFMTIAAAFDGELDCGDATDLVGTSSEINGIFWRIANSSPEVGQETCDPKPFNAEVVSGQPGVLIFSPAPIVNEPSAYFVGEITTLPVTGQPTHVLWYDPDVDGLLPEKVMLWCDVSNETDENGKVPNQWAETIPNPASDQRDAVRGFVNDPDDPLVPPNYPVLPSGETWCIVHSETVTVSGNQSVTIFDVFGTGDPKFR